MEPPSGGSHQVERARVLELLRRHGRNATSFQVMEPGLRYWFDAAGDGVVAYVDTGSAWVVAGAPIAAADQVWATGEQFAAAAREAGRHAVFVCVEQWARDVPWLRFLAIGTQPVWDPGTWPEILAQTRSLREQLRRARAKGVRVRSVPAAEIADAAAPVRGQVDRLIARWLASRAMAPLGFLVTLHPFEYPAERRYFVAERDGEAVGLLAAVPVYRRGGWLLEDFLRAPDAPNGTMEAVFAHAVTELAGEGARHVTLGLAPLAGATGALRAIRDCTRWLYDFEGVRAFKAKLRPGAWEPVYLAWPRGRGPVGPVIDCLRAFAGGSLVRFGAATLVHRRRAVAAWLALLLVPWTAMLAVADPAWFPSRAVQLGWVGFDLAVIALLLRLAWRWHAVLAAVLAVLVTADAALTLAQAALWNAPRAAGAVHAAVIGVSVAAPTFAAWFLWSSRREGSARCA